MSGFDQPTIGTRPGAADHVRPDDPTDVRRTSAIDSIAHLDPVVEAAPARIDAGPAAQDSPENLLHFARRRAMRLVGRRAFTRDDVDDIVQEAYFGLLEAHNERGGRTPNEKLIVDRVTKLASRWHLPADVRYESFAGRRVYLGLVDEFLQVKGRMPSRVEEDVIADGVRAGWHDPEHRPAPDFHRISLTPHVSFDERWCGDDAVEPALADPTDRVGDATPEQVRDADSRDEAAEALAERLTQAQMGAVERRRRAWSLFAQALGLPDAAAASLGPREVTAVKAVVRGRLASIAAEYLDGESDERTTEALFAPFGECTMAQRDLIAAALERNPGEAERLWTSAVNAANRRGASTKTTDSPV
ncbi:hypothetical protein F8O01_10765 [Pseudoclavibacter chungangensis]|uniref:Uncharacterized protein n=1 Tax=Pseudoclavibacter chungangensis TaxID=587635 RepID=A0A7J5BQX3_9MICO|nr:hypothetical protein [Pseudoclavibacter chungangensis]KAB1656340.1 hypothetical protein F8O01_10765 [Pseudoclavibacter chungangensis]NYJ67109.1 hypothetical protein [Pseudoclavibacter chungangensis]